MVSDSSRTGFEVMQGERLYVLFMLEYRESVKGSSSYFFLSDAHLSCWPRWNKIANLASIDYLWLAK